MVKRAIVRATKKTEKMSVSNQVNFARIETAIAQFGYSDKVVKYLADNVIRKERTTGPSTVKALVACVCEMNYNMTGKVVVGKKQRRRALHALMKVNDIAMRNHRGRIFNAFNSEEDKDIKLGLGLLLIANNYPTSALEWMMSNLTDNDVWLTAYFNALTGAIVFDGSSYGFKNLESVWDTRFDVLMQNADIDKLASGFDTPRISCR